MDSSNRARTCTPYNENETETKNKTSRKFTMGRTDDVNRRTS